MNHVQVKEKGKEESLGIIKVKNGYMVTKGKTMYENPYGELYVFNTFAALVKYIGENFNDQSK